MTDKGAADRQSPGASTQILAYSMKVSGKKKEQFVSREGNDSSPAATRNTWIQHTQYAHTQPQPKLHVPTEHTHFYSCLSYT